jgi:hypothetical protein
MLDGCRFLSRVCTADNIDIGPTRVYSIENARAVWRVGASISMRWYERWKARRRSHTWLFGPGSGAADKAIGQD